MDYSHTDDDSKDRSEPMPVLAPRANLPPVETRFKKGQSGNPKGRPATGAALCEWMSSLDRLSQPELLGIVENKRMPATKAAAANQLLRMRERPNMADFEPWLDGSCSLVELRALGVDTSLVKRASISKDGRRSIELHDRAEKAPGSVIDRTRGKPPPIKINAPMKVLIINNPVTGRRAAREQQPVAIQVHDHGHEAEAGPASDGNGQAIAHGVNGNGQHNGHNGKAVNGEAAPAPQPAPPPEPQINLEGPFGLG